MKQLFKCELIKDGFVSERFFRNGESISDIEQQLEIFQWPAGTWEITPDDYDD